MLTALATSFFATSIGKRLPAWAWEIIIIGIAAAVLALGHHVLVVRHDNGVRAAQKRVDDAADQKLAQEAIALKAQIDALTSNISTLLRSQNDEENRAIAADAGNLRLLGPGKAACPRLPVAAPGAGRHVAPAAVPDAAGPALPTDDLAAVPWPWLVQRSEEHDQLRAEVQTWRDWYAKLVAAWPKSAPAK